MVLDACVPLLLLTNLKTLTAAVCSSVDVDIAVSLLLAAHCWHRSILLLFASLLLPQLLRLHAISAFVLHIRLHQWFSFLSNHAVILWLVLRWLLIKQLHLHQPCLAWSICPISIGIDLDRVDCTLRRHLLSSQGLHLPWIIARIQTVWLSSSCVVLTDASILHRTISDNLVCLLFTFFFNR